MTWVSPSAGKSLSAELTLQPREASLDSISLPFQPYLGTQVRTQMFPRPHQKTKRQEKQSASTSLDVFVVTEGWSVISRIPRPQVRPNKQNEGQSICVCIVVVGTAPTPAALASWEKPSLVITGALGFEFPSTSLHKVETLVPAAAAYSDRGLQLYTEKKGSWTQTKRSRAQGFPGPAKQLPSRSVSTRVSIEQECQAWVQQLSSGLSPAATSTFPPGRTPDVSLPICVQRRISQDLWQPGRLGAFWQMRQGRGQQPTKAS